MTFAECFDAIDVALKNLEGVTNAIRNMQHEEIPKLFWRAQEWESFKHYVTILEVSMGVDGEGTSDVS